ncbi:MAG: hypothetical protein QG591_2703 [Planctomycetota bacterium]|nr:hypothetical protein [Planctomycetota bacterium]
MSKVLTMKATIHRNKQKVFEPLDNNPVTVHFQPIFSAKDGVLFGYEAFTRIEGDISFTKRGIPFQKVNYRDVVSSPDYLCLDYIIQRAASLGIEERDTSLFITLCSETLTSAVCKVEEIDGLVGKWGMAKEKIVFEISEESVIHNFNFFHQAIAYYKKRGYKIAIDDFSAGYRGLKILSRIEPDFIKIDRQFLDSMQGHFNHAHRIVRVCQKIGIKFIAKGIAQEEDIENVLHMDIELLQGDHLDQSFSFSRGELSTTSVSQRETGNAHGEAFVIDTIVSRVEPIHLSASIVSAFKRFTQDQFLWGLPVVSDKRIVGMLHRKRFLEKDVPGRRSYRYLLHSHKDKDIVQLMETNFLSVEANTTLEEVAEKVQPRKTEFLSDDICVTKNGKYLGTVAVHALLDAIVKKSLTYTKGSNPLTGLPGNGFIQSEINKRLSHGVQFDLCYIDINYFKSYNDHYGFANGDVVIKTLACIMREAAHSQSPDFNFVGHIGGDDFIVITRPEISVPVSKRILLKFEEHLPEFHDTEDYRKGFYITNNRIGEKERFSLLSLSIGIVSTTGNRIQSYAQLASLAAEVKKTAKAISTGSAIVRNKRIMMNRNKRFIV